MELKHKKMRPVKIYFQLQFGMLLEPVKVSWRCWLPSASMVQICSLPLRVD